MYYLFIFAGAIEWYHQFISVILLYYVATCKGDIFASAVYLFRG